MKMVVVGGNSHGIGKTSVVCAIIAALPQRKWLAIKLTQLGHQIESSERLAHDAAAGAFMIREERDRSGTTDTSRYLSAGADRAFWITVSAGMMEQAMPQIACAIEGGENVIVESNSILRFFEPSVYLSVVDPSTADFKESARKYLSRADAIISVGPFPEILPWIGVEPGVIRQKPLFIVRRNDAASADRQPTVPREIPDFVESRLLESRHARYLFS